MVLWKKEIRDLMERLKGAGMVGDEKESVRIEGMDLVKATAVVYGCKGQDFIQEGFVVGEMVEVDTWTFTSPFWLPVVREDEIKQFHGLSASGPSRGLIVRVGVLESYKHYPYGKENITHGPTSFMDVLLGEESVVVRIVGMQCDPEKTIRVRKMGGKGVTEED